jgi:hypothetical protein
MNWLKSTFRYFFNEFQVKHFSYRFIKIDGFKSALYWAKDLVLHLFNVLISWIKYYFSNWGNKTGDAGNSDSKKKEEDEEKTTGWDVFWIFVGIAAIVRIVRRVMEGQGGNASWSIF